MRRLTAIAAVAALALAACASRAESHTDRVVSWSTTRAEARVLAAPPPSWTKRSWTVAVAVCDGLGSPTLASVRRKGASPAHLVRLFRNFSCEITVVRPTKLCPSLGTYVCVAGWHSTAVERTLHVLDETRYALYRVPE